MNLTLCSSLLSYCVLTRFVGWRVRVSRGNIFGNVHGSLLRLHRPRRQITAHAACLCSTSSDALVALARFLRVRFGFDPIPVRFDVAHGRTAHKDVQSDELLDR